jgi:putative flippase GtrA
MRSRSEATSFATFVATGGIAAGVNVAARWLLQFAVPYETAIALAYLTGMATAFLLARHWVFRAAGSMPGQFARFTLVNAVALVQVLAVSMLLARVALPAIGVARHAETIAHIVGVLSPVATSYMLHKRFSFRAAVAVLVCLLPGRAPAGEPPDADGNVGATSYHTLPFMQQVYRPCSGCSPGLEPAELFFHANPASPFNDPRRMAAARAAAALLERQGIVPAGGAQRWQDTYAATFPAGTFRDEPAAVQRDRARGFFADPDFIAWRDFIERHPQYWDIADDGGTMPPELRGTGIQWGHISPLTPLDPADCPPGMVECTWGDAYAARWAHTAQLSGGYGLMLSDFSDSQPHWPSTTHDFNPRIVAAFAREYGLAVPAGDTPAQAGWIVANAFPEWNDFLSRGYGRFFQALAARLGAATGRAALVIDQCAMTPALRRLFGADARLIAQTIDPRNLVCAWDDHLIQHDRPGPVAAPPMQELAGFVIGAAREPLLRNGASLEADVPEFWATIDRAYPGLDAAARRAAGQGILKRLWLWSAWAHIADRDGQVRRALAFTSRFYWDQGSLALLDPLTRLIQTITPVRPFGPALYYPVSVERAIEAREGRAAGPGRTPATYLPAAALQTLLDAHGLGYYVSDAALAHIHQGGAAVPSAWVVLDAQGLLPAPERAALTALAPVVTSAAELAALPGQPLTLPAGLAGFGFYDQDARLIVVLSVPDVSAAAQPVVGTVRLAGLAPGCYRATDLFSGVTTALAVAAGVPAELPVKLDRWETQVLALAPDAAR